MRCAIRILIALTVFAGLPSVTGAEVLLPNQVIVVDDDPSSANFGSGGAFRLFPNAATYPNGSFFITFCLENNEYFDPGQSLQIEEISGSAKLGGSNGGNGTEDPISNDTKVVYSQFRKGTAAFQDRTVLQEVIWWLEGEYNFGQPASSLSTAAQTMIGLIPSYSIYGSVDVLNLKAPGTGTGYTAPLVRKQDMLTWMTPEESQLVPEPTSLLLLGTGLFAASAAARRRRAKK
jgi:hypothetical protein